MTMDREEAAECEKMHGIIGEGKMEGKFRWINAQKNRVRNGELYRYVADRRGAFVQPALYEAFGLTVVEAMSCGVHENECAAQLRSEKFLLCRQARRLCAAGAV